MPAVDAIIEYGTMPANEFPVDEPNILLKSLKVSPKREKKSYKGPDKVTRALRYQDPTIEFDFDGQVMAFSGFCDQHPGTLVDSLANFGDTIHEFDPDDGILVYEDPQRDGNNEDLVSCQFKVIQYPFISPPSAPKPAAAKAKAKAA